MLRRLFQGHGAPSGLAILCFALGLGVNACLLSVLDLLLVAAPAGVASPGELHRLYFTLSIPGMGTFTSGSTSYPNYADLRAAAGGFSDLAAYFPTEIAVGRGTAARRVSAAVVSDNFFPLLGVAPAAGRLFTAADRAPVAVVGDRMARRLGGGPAPLGSRLALGGKVYTVVGVLPAAFHGIELAPVDLWLPLEASADLGMGPRWREQRGSSFLEVLGRLSPRATARQAAGQASGVFQRAVRQDDPQVAARVLTGPIQRAADPSDPSDRRIPLWLAGVSFLVLAVACGNVAHLLFVRNLGRRRELAVRLALGSGRARLVASMLGESLLLALLGGVAALGLYGAGLRLLQAFLLPDGALLRPGRSFAILAGLLPAAGLLAGLVPAIWASRADPGETLKGGGLHGARSSSGLLRALAAFQVALTVLALAGAGLFLLSLLRLADLHAGFEAERVVVAVFDQEPGSSTAAMERLYQEARERVLRLPGIEGASLAAGIPLASSFALELHAPGHEVPRPPTGGPYVNAVSPDFFRTLGSRLRRGRGFEEGESAPVAIVNETMARLVWPGEDPLGRCLRIGRPDAPCSAVVGVVEDSLRSQLREEATPQYYVPLHQAPALLSSRALLVRVAAEDAASQIAAIRRQVLAISPGLPYLDVLRLADLAAPQIRPWRTGALVFGLFGGLALVLSVVGVYGTVAQAVAQRTRELGVRFALGAPWRDAFWSVARPSLWSAALGIAAGLGAVLLAGRRLQPLLFEVSSRDARVLSLAVLLVLAVAWIAVYVPARRVRAIAPADALRGQ